MDLSISNEALDNNDVLVATAAVQPDLLEYPRDFFDLEYGALPSTPEAAALLWPYRKNRPRRGLVETEAPDGQAMLDEMRIMRENLRKWIDDLYFEGVRSMAINENFLIATTQDKPVLIMDFKKILASLENTPANQQQVLKVFHQFHRNRDWLATAIDAWFSSQNMCLMQHVILPNKKKYAANRGGFSVVARQAKAQAVGFFMHHMLNKSGWSLALTKSSRKKKKRKNL